jgi:hypothetical protein
VSLEHTQTHTAEPIASSRATGGGGRRFSALTAFLAAVLANPALAFQQQQPFSDTSSAPAIAFDGDMGKFTAVEQAANHGDVFALYDLLQQGEPDSRAAAFRALAASDLQVATTTLLKAVTDATAPNRLQSLQLLAEFPQVDESTMLSTLSSLLDDSDALMKSCAMHILATRNDPESTGLLNHALSATDASTQGAEEPRNLASIKLANGINDAERIRPYLQDTNAAVQAAAFQALASQDSVSAVNSLLSVFRDTGSPSRVQALQLLAQSPLVSESDLLQSLQEAAKDSDPSVQSYAVSEIARRTH